MSTLSEDDDDPLPFEPSSASNPPSITSSPRPNLGRLDESCPDPSKIERAIYDIIQRAPVAGVDGDKASDYAGKEGELATKLYQEISEGRYQPMPYLLLYMDRGSKRRELRLPAFRDRVLMQVWMNEFGEALWSKLPASSVGGRLETGHLRVLEQVKKALNEHIYTSLLRLDVKDFYDNISQILIEDGLTRHLGVRWAKQWVMLWLGTPSVFGGQVHLPPDKGIPTGLPLSALLSSLALENFDRWVLKQEGVFYRRYYDDMLLLLERGDPAELLGRLNLRLNEDGLHLNADKTLSTQPTEAWSYLGQDWVENGFVPTPKPPAESVRFVGSAGSSLCGQLVAKLFQDGLPTGDGEGSGNDQVLELSKLVAIEVEASGKTARWYANCHLQKPLRTLYLQDQGSNLVLRRGHFVVEKESVMLREIPWNRIGQVVVMGHVQISSGVLRACLKNRICVTFLSNQGRYYGRLEDPGNIRIRTEKLQWELLNNEAQRVAIAKKIVAARLANARTVILRNLKGARKGQDIEKQLTPELDQLKNAGSVLGQSNNVEELMGKEGYFSQLMFKAYARLWNSIGAFHFKERNRQPPKDPINSMLSFGYTLLQYNVRSILELCGFNPRVGLYHSMRQGHASLASDLMEEFRAPVVESAVQVALGNGVFKPEDFRHEKDDNGQMACLMSFDARRRFIEIFEMTLGREIRHPEFGLKGDYRRMIHLQVLHLVHVLETQGPYKAFRVR